MATIAVTNIGPHVKVQHIVKFLSRAIRGDFKVLQVSQERAVGKVCYVKLHGSLDPLQTIEDIKRFTKFRAYVPDNPPVVSRPLKKGQLPQKLKGAHNTRPVQVFIRSHREILEEMQYKYTGLLNLSKKTGHKLMDQIARTVFERLKVLTETNPECLETGFKMTQLYRRLHPHFGDFQLVLSTLHRLQDAAGAPRSELSEHALVNVSEEPYALENIPLKKLQAACQKYSDKISLKLKEYVASLSYEASADDSEEEAARKRVHEQLHKMSPYLHQIIKQVITNNFIPDKMPYHRVRMYGEPFMPRKEVMSPLLRRFSPVHFMRSDRMFNMLRFNVPVHQLAGLMALDGTEAGGAKFIIRSSDVPKYYIPKALNTEMWALFGETGDDEEEDEEEIDQDVDMNETEWITMSEG